MKVTRVATGSSAATRRNEQSSETGGQFSRVLSGSSQPAAPMTSGGVGPMNALLSLQEVTDPTTGRRRAVKRGFGLLDQLEALRLHILDGSISPEALDGLSAALAEREPVDDPALAGLLSDIEVRVAVELAKRGR